MADSELQNLTELTAPAAADVCYIVDDPAGTPLPRKVQVSNLIGYLVTTAGDILYATAARTLARLGIGTAGQVLKVNAGATAPVWGSGGKTRLSLPPSAGYPPDDSSGSAAAQLQMKITSDTTDPQVRWPELLFDTTTEEHWYWSFAMPDNYGSAPVVDVYYKATSATSGTAAFNCKLMAVTPADASDCDGDEFAVEQTAASETVPGTAGYLSLLSITVANADSVAANDWVVLGVFRDVSADNASGDLEVPMVVLRYTGA